MFIAAHKIWTKILPISSDGARKFVARRFITKVRLKWVKNRGLDHVIDTESDIKAACIMKDAIKRSPTGFLTEKVFSDWKKLLGLTVPVIRFLRRYRTLFKEFPHERYTDLPCFRLTEAALLLDSQEQSIHQQWQNDTADRLCKLLMMTRNRRVPLEDLYLLKWDMGLPDGFEKNFLPIFPDHFRVNRSPSTGAQLELVQWQPRLAVSALEKSNECDSREYRDFKKAKSSPVVFRMRFPRGYGAQKKVIAWMDEFQKLPYISPYDNPGGIDPNSELMEKRCVALLHELLSITIHKKTKRNYITRLIDELVLPPTFTRLFTRYSGIFYLSLKCKTTTVVLREGYEHARLVNPHPLVVHRYKFHHVMRAGIVHGDKGALPPLDDSEESLETEQDYGTDDEDD